VGIGILATIGLTIGAPEVIIVGGVVVLTVLVVDAVTPGADQRHEEIQNYSANIINQTFNGINVLLHKGDWMPKINPERRNDWQPVSERYKEVYGADKGFQLPKSLAQKLADLLNKGKSVEDAVDEMPELDEYHKNNKSK
jgi:hypothetical protein